MKTKVFSVYDSKALCYGVPFFMPSTGAAVRAFGDLANDSQSMVFKHGTDFVLYEIGLFDDSNGILSTVAPFVNLGIGADFVERKPVLSSKGGFPSLSEIREIASDAAISNGGQK